MIDYQVGEIVGFRIFRLEPNATLGSYSAPHVWLLGENVAVCASGRRRRQHGTVPALGCGCGFWMYKDLGRCARMFRLELSSSPRSLSATRFGSFEPEPTAVLGRSRAWGRVLEGDDGWRAEFAAVDELYDIGQGLDLRAAADRYQVPLSTVELDLALTVVGILSERDDSVGADGRVGILVNGKSLQLRTDSRAFFEAWRLPLGTQVRVALDPNSGDVANIFRLDPANGTESSHR
jgi:hypothetical protein